MKYLKKKALYDLIKNFIWQMLRLAPIRNNKIFVVNFLGRGYGDNPKYIVEELLKSNENLQIIWAVKDDKEAKTLPSGVKYCKIFSKEYFYHLVTSAVWIDNCRKEVRYKKNRQLYIQTWHGGGAQKRIESDVLESLTEDYVRIAKNDSKNIDLFLSDSRFQTELYYRACWYNGFVAEWGFPRYDIILHQNEMAYKKICDYFKLDCNKKIVLYVPTFRKDMSLEAYSIDYARLRTACHKRFGGEYIVLVRLHPNIAEKSGELGCDNQMVIDATNYPDIQELIAATDIMISDYSSASYDFCLTGKPALRFATDIGLYRNDRGCYFDIDVYPFPLAENNDELDSIICSFDFEQYRKDLDHFFKLIGTVRQENVSKKCANIIIDYVRMRGNKQAFFQKYKNVFLTPSDVSITINPQN